MEVQGGLLIFTFLSDIIDYCIFIFIHIYCSDLGYLDEEGFCHLSGRNKDMIIRGGENIYPTEIENFLLEHPKIADVQVKRAWCIQNGILDEK